jgi:hypothetical protein
MEKLDVTCKLLFSFHWLEPSSMALSSCMERLGNIMSNWTSVIQLKLRRLGWGGQYWELNSRYWHLVGRHFTT